MINILAHILCYDIWFYVSHIILHNRNIYFIHKIHHSRPYAELTYRDTNVAHNIENIVQPIGILVPCFFYFCYSELSIAFCVITIRGLMRHDDRFSWITGNHHLLHHKYINYNFGEYWIDRLFGTTYPNKREYIFGVLYT
jgi:sterol desaturase/sphingolipid hydroxylase (fatty acid hydroxylase superfamily)